MARLIIFLTATILLAFNGVAQDTWRIVEGSQEEKGLYLNVYNLNNKIYTSSTTVIWNESIPHVKTNLISLNYNSNLVQDTLFGSINYTFVSTVNVQGVFENNLFYIPCDHRYPINPGYEPKGFIVLDTNYNIIHKHEIPPNPIKYEWVSAIVPELDTVFTIANMVYINSGGTYSSSIRLQKLTFSGDTLLQTDIVPTPNIPNRTFTKCSMHKFEDHYYLVASQIAQNGWSDPPSNLHIYKLDNNFNIVSSIKTTNNRYYSNNCSAVFDNGDFVVGGLYSEDPNIGGLNDNGILWQKYIRKYDKNLNEIWTTYIGSISMGGGITKLIVTDDGGVAGCGMDGVTIMHQNGDSVECLTGVVFKLDGNGELDFYKHYYAVTTEVSAVENNLWDIAELPDGGFVTCGDARSFWPYFERGWIMRVGPDGFLEGHGNASELSIVELDIHGIFIYPNPATEQFTVNSPDKVKYYEIYNSSGELILQGSTFPVSLSTLSHGSYFVRLTLINNEVSNHKIVVK